MILSNVAYFFLIFSENDGQDGGIEAADVSSLLEQFEEGWCI